ncbi:MAG: GMC family oxidoreductase [Pirellula sp.]|nr:GMC family oxidoreductase [Pirellula sp.]
MEYDFDAIVIGSGAGGAAFAGRLAKAGKSVLVVERGANPLQNRPNSPDSSPISVLRDERATMIDKRWYDDRKIDVNNSEMRLYIGGIVGGSTALFGGAMMRPSVDDFHPGRRYADRLSRELWDWPVAYEELAPYFAQAESLYHVAAGPDDEYGPLASPTIRRQSDLLPLAPINERVVAANRSAGLRPFRLPLAIDVRRCERCDACAGFLCPNGARRSAAHILTEARDSGSLNITEFTEAERLERSPAGRIDGVVLKNRGDGTRRVLRGRVVALAAGALASPAIALRSGIEGPQVGRNYMMHYSPIAVGIFPQPTGAGETFVKQIGFADYYFGTPQLPEKMGIVQSLPAPGPLMMAKLGLKRWPAGVRNFLRNRMLLLAGIVEDLPNPDNRVFLGDGDKIALRHDFSEYDRTRGKALGREMRRILRRSGAVFQSSRSFPSREHVAHQCGTLRFGRDPRHAAADRDGRLFGHENLFVVDGSVLPTSTGVGPSLTITALALRCADAALAGM